MNIAIDNHRKAKKVPQNGLNGFKMLFESKSVANNSTSYSPRDRGQVFTPLFYRQNVSPLLLFCLFSCPLYFLEVGK